MLILASSSPTRAKILASYGIKFEQISFDFDESVVDKIGLPHNYVLNVVKAKKEQFFKEYKGLNNVIFADSCVVCDDKILGKARDRAHAKEMLNLQSGNTASVITATIFYSQKFELISTSETTYKFAKFNQSDMDKFIESGECMGKAGAMMIEGFNKNYILSQDGTTDNAMGLNISLLKAFL